MTDYNFDTGLVYGNLRLGVPFLCTLDLLLLLLLRHIIRTPSDHHLGMDVSSTGLHPSCHLHPSFFVNCLF
jgi:hypothetical protein